ncbi:MAG: hypothetical protein SGPRY_003324, partial [Prymnesium sp.]
ASKDVEELSEFALPIVLRANANSTSNVEGGDAIDYQGAANSSSGSVNERKETVESTQAVASQPAEPADVLPPPIEEMRQLKNDAEETAMQDNEPADTPAEYAAWDEDEILPLEQFKQQALLKIQTDPNFHPATLDPAHAASSVVSGSTSDGREGQLGIALPWERPNVPLKDRFNYLASDAGAKVVAKAPEMKSVRDVLTEDRDKYMTCERVVKKKWITLSLIEDILLDTIVLANFEYYSSSVRKFQVLGSQSYPCHAWALLGEFEANDTRLEQVFELARPMWVRYLKLRFLTHHGSQHYWSLSLIRAHGQTRVDKFNSDHQRLQASQEKMLPLQKEGGNPDDEAPDVARDADASGQHVVVANQLPDGSDEANVAEVNQGPSGSDEASKPIITLDDQAQKIDSDAAEVSGESAEAASISPLSKGEIQGLQAPQHSSITSESRSGEKSSNAVQQASSSFIPLKGASEGAAGHHAVLPIASSSLPSLEIDAQVDEHANMLHQSPDAQQMDPSCPEPRDGEASMLGQVDSQISMLPLEQTPSIEPEKGDQPALPADHECEDVSTGGDKPVQSVWPAQHSLDPGRQDDSPRLSLTPPFKEENHAAALLRDASTIKNVEGALPSSLPTNQGELLAANQPSPQLAAARLPGAPTIPLAHAPPVRLPPPTVSLYHAGPSPPPICGHTAPVGAPPRAPVSKPPTTISPTQLPLRLPPCCVPPNSMPLRAPPSVTPSAESRMDVEHSTNASELQAKANDSVNSSAQSNLSTGANATYIKSVATMAPTNGRGASVQNLPPSESVSPPSDPLQAMARLDPNNIFNALTKRLVTLELNQTLINNWLTIWQSQITSRFKTLNLTQEETTKRMRGVQVNVSQVQSLLQETREDVSMLFNSIGGGTNNVSDAVHLLQDQISKMHAEWEKRERLFRSEVDALLASRRSEGILWILLVLAAVFSSWMAALRYARLGEMSLRAGGSDRQHTKQDCVMLMLMNFTNRGQVPAVQVHLVSSMTLTLATRFDCQFCGMLELSQMS